MSTTREAKAKKDKSTKKSKSVEKSEVSEKVAETIEDTPMPGSAPKALKVKKEKSSKKRKSIDNSEPTENTADISEDAMMSESKPKKSKRSRKTAEGTEETEPAPESMDVDNDDSSEPPSKKQKSFTLPSEIAVDVTLPQPPSKKELRRLKKGKPLPKSKTKKVDVATADASEGEEGEKDEAKPKKPEVEKRSEHGIWVGNLPWSVSKDDLRRFLIENGGISNEAIPRIHMPSPADSKPANHVSIESKYARVQHNKGFAYVDFSTAADTEKAVELSEQLLGGRRVLIKNNKSFEGRPLKSKEETKKEGKAPSKRIFLGNLRFDTTEESLKEHFERCGPIETCMVATFEDSGKCKGYAWITFEEIESAERAVRGFYLEPDADSEDEASDGEDDVPDSDAEDAEEALAALQKPKKVKKQRMKRVYVNMIARRPVRIEFAEDAQVRYKKRYGKNGTKNSESGEGGDAVVSRGAEGASEERERRPAKVLPSKKVEYRNEYAPRLTGGIVESKGTKVTF
jgi:RNA recognition motif-containing protein